MRLTCQEHLIPGDGLLEKWEFLAQAGWDGIELHGHGGGTFRARASELRAARDAGVPLRTVCVIADRFIGDFDAERRAEAIATMKELLSGIAEAGGVGAITPASYGMFSRALPPFTPPRSAEEDREILLAALAELGEHAQREGVWLLLEPLNRYEDHMLNTLAQAAELAEETGRNSVKVIADVFHMNIEEPDPAAALREAGARLAHVHLADSNREQPFAGHVAWEAVLGALAAIGYRGDLACECRISGDARLVLPDLARRLRTLAALTQSH
jgi:sugar phosphate isomerase/epimerase